MNEYKFPVSKLKIPTTNNEKPLLVLVGTGSFNPITYMHLRMMEMAKDYYKDKFEILGGYLSPVGDAYDKKTLIETFHRVNMLQLSLKDSDWIMLDTFESSLPVFTPTKQVLDHIKQSILNYLKFEKNITNCNNISIKLVCGADLLGSFNIPKLWSDIDMDLLTSKDYGMAVLERLGTNIDEIISKNEILTKNRDVGIDFIPIDISNDVSSTKIREKIRKNQSIKYLIPDKVVKYINDNNIYKTEIPNFRNKL